MTSRRNDRSFISWFEISFLFVRSRTKNVLTSFRPENLSKAKKGLIWNRVSWELEDVFGSVVTFHLCIVVTSFGKRDSTNFDFLISPSVKNIFLCSEKNKVIVFPNETSSIFLLSLTYEYKYPFNLFSNDAKPTVKEVKVSSPADRILLAQTKYYSLKLLWSGSSNEINGKITL